MELLLGIDVGSSRTKAALVDAEGREVGNAGAPTPFESTGGRVEMDVDALVACLSRVLDQLGDGRRQVVAVGVAGMAESGAPLDATGRPLARILAWHDGRGEETVEVLQDRFGDALALRAGQTANTKMTVAKLGWLLDHGLEGMTRWLGVPELVLRALTGEEATEYSLAARTGCYDVTAHRWMPEVAEAAGFPTDVFAAVQPAGRVMGRVTAAGSLWSGVPHGVPVTVAGHDHPAGMAGAGVGPGDLANSVGTAETVVRRTARVPNMAAARDNRVAVSVYPGGQEWAVLVGAARAGLVIESAAAALGLSPAELDGLADGAEPVDADLAGAVDDLAKGGPASLPDAPPGRIWAGLLRALTARTVDGYERVANVVGPADRVVVFGGGSRSEPWLRAKAEALPVPVVRSTVASSVARGAAVHAGVAAGWWTSEAAAPRPPASAR
ncbi:MAG TPA: FGGY family carbohydrate kinase [Acidimicrobiales bacterium]|nr:FGGY family carbohydrate kinase [Acidimicrobiales bacterium]